MVDFIQKSKIMVFPRFMCGLKIESIFFVISELQVFEKKKTF